MTVKTFDSKCYELAEHFLSDLDHPPTATNLADEKKQAEALAICIQQAVEDWFDAGRPSGARGDTTP